jgi:hypothetical protein
MRLERSDVGHPLWRKKVDSSLLKFGGTALPNWVVRMWEISKLFSHKAGRYHPKSRVKLEFQKRIYDGDVIWYPRAYGGVSYRLWFDEELRFALAQTFVMSNMRDLEGRLQAAAGLKNKVEKDIPFWEFLDIEFDRKRRRFLLNAYYHQEPSFPFLFKRMAGAPALKRIRDELAGKSPLRIYKQEWRPREQSDLEIGTTNVIYMLADTTNRLLYIGETDNLVARLRGGHEQIPDWNFYRFDALPAAWAPHRLQLERMLICDFEQLLHSLPSFQVRLRLVNVRVDRPSKRTPAKQTGRQRKGPRK